MIYNRRKKSYNRPRFNVCPKSAAAAELTASAAAGTAPVKRLQVVATAGTAPEPEFKRMTGRKLAAAAVLGGVMWAKAAPAADLRR